jgi:hypothetical protein
VQASRHLPIVRGTADGRYHLLVPDGVFAEAGNGLAFVRLPVPTGADLLAILDRVIRQVARRLAKEAAGVNDPDDADLPLI